MNLWRHLKAPAVVLALDMTLGHSASRTLAQKPAPVAPNPQAPVLNMPFPMGIQRGTSLELTLTGSNLVGPTGVLTDFPAKITIPTDKKNGTEGGKLRIHLQVPADAPVGFHPLRLATARGMSNLRLFCVDDLPQVLATGTSHDRAKPQSLPVPCVVAGTIAAEKGSYFKIGVKAGQRLTFDVLGRRLGGPLDPEITLFDGPGTRELGHQNDSPGCQTDPRLTYHFKRAGEYLIEIKDVLNRGGADYPFRLRIGDVPNATVPIPMAAQRGSAVSVSFAGPMVEGVSPVLLKIPSDSAVDTVLVAPKSSAGLCGWPVALAVTNNKELIEQEPNDNPAKAQRLEVPCGVTARLLHSNDLDLYRFAAKKGQKLRIQINTLELFSPTLVYMVLKNGKTMGVLGQSKPEAAPPADQRLDFNVPEDGEYLLEVQHLNYVGGPSEAYHLTVAPETPDFDLSVGLDRFDIAAGSPLPINVQAVRRGYSGPIDLTVAGQAGLSGIARLEAGQTNALLVVDAKPDVPLGPYVIRVQGKANVEGKAIMRFVDVRAAISQSLGNLHFPPRELTNSIAVAVREKPPFSLAMAWKPAQTYSGSSAKVTITAKRNPGFDDPINVNTLIGLPPNVPQPKFPPIPKGKTDTVVDVGLPKAPLGTYPVLVSATAKHQGKDYAAISSPVSLVVGLPFTLKVEPAVVQIKQGAKSKLKITAARIGGYSGPIAVEVRKLPAGVTAAKTNIATGQNAVDLEVTAAPAAATTKKADVDALGIASSANNQQNASPAFTIVVLKK